MTTDASAVASYSSERTYDERLGEAIHQELWRRRIKQTEFAQTVLGITQSALSQKLRGRRPFFAGEVSVIAKSLGMSVSELMPDIELAPGGDDDGGATGAPSRARTYDLRINTPSSLPFASVTPLRSVAA